VSFFFFLSLSKFPFVRFGYEVLICPANFLVFFFFFLFGILNLIFAAFYRVLIIAGANELMSE